MQHLWHNEVVDVLFHMKIAPMRSINKNFIGSIGPQVLKINAFGHTRSPHQLLVWKQPQWWYHILYKRSLLNCRPPLLDFTMQGLLLSFLVALASKFLLLLYEYYSYYFVIKNLFVLWDVSICFFGVYYLSKIAKT